MENLEVCLVLLLINVRYRYYHLPLIICYSFLNFVNSNTIKCNTGKCIHIHLQFSSLSMLVNVKLYINEYKRNTF